MSDAIVKFCKAHAVGLVVAFFTAGGVYAKVVVDMGTLQDNHTELQADFDKLENEQREHRLLLERALTILETAYPAQKK